ncbi:hypothetical protein NDU88_008602 [Pleurodeles waltl]|uniref:Uncharacterized protein n=1 Tax=Pleurodeles waltl TaxID=8319 RepID=A0AAV7NZT5_PLEWA|nr:hypothetical protein NDU88_008602 [Pleurodeles waltl]
MRRLAARARHPNKAAARAPVRGDRMVRVPTWSQRSQRQAAASSCESPVHLGSSWFELTSSPRSPMVVAARCLSTSLARR